MKAAIAVACAVIFGCLGDILLSMGMRNGNEISIKRPSDLPIAIKMVFTNPLVLLGITSMAIYFGTYIAALAWADVSVVNPLTALSYVLATAYAAIRMRETVTKSRWTGVVLIALGSMFIGLSSR
jgi:drug/metabolite transporter (DMT)-like permease